MGKAYLYASMSDDLQNSTRCRLILLDKASAAFKAALELDPLMTIRTETDELFELISDELEELELKK